ncbi:AraC family transcriptional regulator [Marinibaculum pumilum]|uniref:AraC family transcriptional regulator n=1 Tax=Marinibaculum pumilum TaxID=1766165 RepID=A0ABV7KU86_9PROT
MGRDIATAMRSAGPIDAAAARVLAMAAEAEGGPPVAAMARDFAPGHRIPPHRHRRAQLIYAATGVLRVSTASGTWITPPQRAVWMPAGIEHRIDMVGAVAMRTLYLRAPAAAAMPRECAVVAVRPLLRELILAMVEVDMSGDTPPARRRRRLLTALIRNELRTVPVVPLRIPMPADPRLSRLCAAILAEPAAERSLEEWGAEVGASARTLARLARQELGMSLGAWRQQVRLAEAVAQMATGEPVARAAARAGYASASAFSAMFRRALGTTPKAYLREGGGSAEPAAAAQ